MVVWQQLQNDLIAVPHYTLTHLLRRAGRAARVDQHSGALSRLPALPSPRAGCLLSRTAAAGAAGGPILALLCVPPFVHCIRCCGAHRTGRSQRQQASPVPAAAAGSGGSGPAGSSGTLQRSRRNPALSRTCASSPACRRAKQRAARDCRLSRRSRARQLWEKRRSTRHTSCSEQRGEQRTDRPNGPELARPPAALCHCASHPLPPPSGLNNAVYISNCIKCVHDCVTTSKIEAAVPHARCSCVQWVYRRVLQVSAREPGWGRG